jgi:DNA repair photolyase
MEKLDKSQMVGITESSEVSFNLDIFDRLYDGNIIITKRLTTKLIDKLVENKNKIILHLTCTGWGGSKLEPFVPKTETTRKKFGELIEKGFPIEHCVLRIDPCVPTKSGIEVMCGVVRQFSDTGIKRVRFSVLDMYEHVKKRFKEKGLEIPYETFHAPLEVRKKMYDILVGLGREYEFEVEACAEPGIESVPCLSQKDIDILGLTDRITLVGNKGQRSNCHCPSNKQELINSEDKAKQCKNSCLYCFWRK